MLKIKIEHNEEYQKLTMTGHCGFAKEGKDIVCSAASILCLSFAQVLRENKDKLEEEPLIHLGKGKAKLKWKVKPKYEGSFKVSLYTITCGFRFLEKEYPIKKYMVNAPEGTREYINANAIYLLVFGRPYDVDLYNRNVHL